MSHQIVHHHLDTGVPLDGMGPVLPAAQAFHRKVGLRQLALFDPGFRRPFHQPGQDELQVAPDAEELSGILGGCVLVHLLEIPQHFPVRSPGHAGDVEVLRQKVAAVQLDRDGEADGDELELLAQGMTLQLAALRDIKDLVLPYQVLLPIHPEHRAALEDIAQHAVGHVTLRVRPSPAEDIPIHIQKDQAHGRIQRLWDMHRFPSLHRTKNAVCNRFMLIISELYRWVQVKLLL